LSCTVVIVGFVYLHIALSCSGYDFTVNP